MMKRTISIAILVLAAVFPAPAQTGPQDFKARYERQARNVGPAGVGVETILDNWEAVDPDNLDLIEARFNFYLNKGLETKLFAKDQDKFMGAGPVFVLNDSTGRPVRYFQEDVYDDGNFGLALQTIEKAIALRPDDLAYVFDKITALVGYEKESPDMAGGELLALVNRNASARPAWTFYGEPVGEEDFTASVQQYCYTFYTIGSPGAMETFRVISERMNKLYPRNVDFLGNLGSYWLTGRDDPKKAMKYYDKVLKLNPGDEAASRNKEIAQRRIRQLKDSRKKKR